MYEWPKWNKTEPARIARYVHASENARVFGVPAAVEATDFDQRRTARSLLVRRVYEHLVARRIAYDTAEIDFANFHEPEQVIRQPEEVKAAGGNCVELVLVFASLCQKLKLYPMVILLEKHALVAVRLDRDVEQMVGTGRPPEDDYPSLSRGLLAPGADRGAVTSRLVQLAEESRWLFVECTGYASSRELNGPIGTLSFEAAVTRGVEELRTGQVKDLVDVSYLQRHGVQRPYTPRPPTSTMDERVELGRFGIDMLRERFAERTERLERYDLDSLTALRESIQDENAGVMLSKLCRALEATTFVRHWMPSALNSQRLRAALVIAGIEAAPGETFDDRDYLTHVALHHPLTDPTCERALVLFVIAVALDAELDVHTTAFTGWAYSMLDPVTVNDLLHEARHRIESARLRLVLSLQGSLTGGWPESVTAWLLDGDEIRVSETAPCSPPNQQSAEAAIGMLLNWAAAELGGAAARLERIDVAVPTALLPHWRPEETKVGSRLGLHHMVVVRWSERLNPPPHISYAMREADKRWTTIEQRCGVTWLETHDTRDHAELLEQLECGAYPGGMGLRFTPSRDEQLLEILLSFSPILLWPDRELASWDGVEDKLQDNWNSLPYALTLAYRHSWPPRREMTPLSGLRAVWDDQDWLRFCRKAQNRARIARSGGAA